MASLGRWRLDAMLLLAIVGVGVAAYLTKVGFDPERTISCGPLGDCHTVQSSQYADVAGVPVALLGLGMYLALLGLLAARRWGPWASMAPSWVPTAVFAIALAGTLYSAYLTYLELWVIDAICAWCVASALIITAMFVLALPDARSAGRSTAGTV